jgi:Sec-independent protein translocase protein TatA
MLTGLTLQQISFLVILVVAFVLLLTERLRNDLVQQSGDLYRVS